ncbi:MAG: alpha/beta hydrolase fold domain-containing protein [Legionellales bacterium]|nr:alpha/beta hydrolase fold domain-containing protein [Legionellales bacterium]
MSLILEKEFVILQAIIQSNISLATFSLRGYLPKTKQGMPVIFYIHGAGFIAGSIKTHGSVCRLLSEKLSYAIILIDYYLRRNDWCMSKLIFLGYKEF